MTVEQVAAKVIIGMRDRGMTDVQIYAHAETCTRGILGAKIAEEQMSNIIEIACDLYAARARKAA